MSNYLVSQADIIGRQPLLRINDMPRNQTLLGGSLCIIVYCFFILSSLYFGQELVYKVLPKIVEEEKTTNKEDIIYLSKEQFNFFFAFSNNGVFINPTKYFEINLSMKSITNYFPSYEKINIGTCQLSDFESKENNDFSYKLLDLNQFICVKQLDDTFYVKGTDKFDYYTTLQLNITPYKNNESLLETFLKNSYLSIFYFETNLNFREFTKFSNTFIKKFNINFNKNFMKKIDVTLSLTKIYTDVGYMFEIFKKKKLHNVKKIEQFFFDKTEEDDNGYQATINFQLSYTKTNIYRKYYKIQNWVAELGGIIRAMTLIASFINYFNDRASFYEMLINKLFDVDDIIKYFQFNDLFINKQNKRRKRDSIVLRNAKREKDYFEKGESRFLHNFNEKKSSPHQTNNFLKIPNKKNSNSNLVKEDTFGFITNQMVITPTNKEEIKGYNNTNNNNNNLNSNNNNENNSIISSVDDEREIYIDNLKKNASIKEHFEKVRSNRFSLSGCEALKFCLKNDKENPKFNSFIGGRELLRERTDLIYILKKNLELDRFKNLILKDNQLVLLNSLTRFMLDPERVNLVDFDTCSYEKFIDCYDNVAVNSNMIDLKLAKWVETKFKFDQHNPSAL